MGKIKKSADKAALKSEALLKPKNVVISKVQKKKPLRKTAKKITKVIKNEPVINENSIKLNDEQTRKAVENVIQLINVRNQNKSTLFEDEIPIFLQIEAIKVPNTPSRTLRVTVPHTLVSYQSEVCLIVPDLDKKSIKDTEKTIKHYQELLSSHQINVKNILPFYELKTEYEQFEMKRRLLATYDFFMVDAKISGKVFKALGKIFLEKRKQPVPIKLETDSLKTEIEKCLSKVNLSIHGKGNTYITQIGHSHMEIDQIVENVEAFTRKLETQFPGGGNNIRSIYMKSTDTAAIPVYYSLKIKTEVPTVTEKPKRAKAFAVQRDELSTFLNTDVSVYPDGTVVVHKDKSDKSSKRKNNTNKSVEKEITLENNDQETKVDSKKKKNKKINNISTLEGHQIENEISENDPKEKQTVKKKNVKKTKKNNSSAVEESKIEEKAKGDDNKENKQSKKKNAKKGKGNKNASISEENQIVENTLKTDEQNNKQDTKKTNQKKSRNKLTHNVNGKQQTEEKGISIEKKKLTKKEKNVQFEDNMPKEKPVKANKRKAQDKVNKTEEVVNKKQKPAAIAETKQNKKAKETKSTSNGHINTNDEVNLSKASNIRNKKIKENDVNNKGKGKKNFKK